MRPATVLAVALLLGAASASAKKEHGKHRDNAPADEATDSRTGYALMVACSPPGADVLVDGEKVGVAPMEKPVPVQPGEHTLKVTKLGYAPFLDTFATKRRVEKREVELVPVSGVLHVKANLAGARVLLDGKFVGEAPVDVEMDVGARAVQVEKGGYKDFFKNVLAVAGKDERLDVQLVELPPELNPYVVKPLPPAKLYQKWWFWGVTVGAFVVAAIAVAVGVLAPRTDFYAPADVVFDCSAMHCNNGFLISR